MTLSLAEVVTIGDEILYGQITDTNSQWISAELDKIGIKTIRKSSIGDSKEEILAILNESSKRANIVLITGGLGPTKDDITKKTLAEFTNDTMVINEHALAFITDFFTKRGREMSEINKLQAAIPSKATYIHNAVGTAPGMWFEHNGTVFISMPGVPHEMKWLMSNSLLPKLQERFSKEKYVHKIIRTVGIGESFLAEKIEEWEDALPSHIKLAYLPGKSQVKLRLTGIGLNEAELKTDIDKEIAKVLPLIENYVFSLTNENFEAAIGRMLLEHNSTLATAESCTGGNIAAMITSIPGSSAYFIGSVVSYANSAKVDVLGVEQEVLDTVGAVSEQTVIQMAEGAKKKFNTTYAIATSGIAGPGGGSEEKPVGTIWIACAGPNGTKAIKTMMLKDRLTNIEFGSVAALNMLRQSLINDNK
ncbi:competence/damage-inducible protein cinA [Spirosomataceae bacterium TFI 002]|nr:competence/damage-inducible protein cinA [Spirosomataceae bacterium TFI 002]